MQRHQLQLNSPLGPLFLLASERGLTGVYWHRQDFPWLDQEPAAPSAQHLFRAAEQITAYLNGTRRTFDLALDCEGTEFQRLVWSELSKIPYGMTITYKELAERVQRPKAWRAVGTANGKNPLCLLIPCHRVISSNASLGGYSGGLDRKRWLLDLEKR